MGLLNIVRGLTGRDTEAISGDVAELEAQIAAIRAEATSASMRIDQLALESSRAETLEAAEAAERAMVASRRVIAHADRRLPVLQAALKRARDEHAQRRAKVYQEHTLGLYSKLKEAVKACAAVQAEVLTAYDAARGELGDALTAREIPAVAFRGLIVPDLVEMWIEQTDRIVASVAGTAAPPPAQRSAPRVVQVPARRPQAPPGPLRIPRKHAPAPVPGGVRVRVLRDGFESVDGVLCFGGEIIELPPDHARVAASNGAVEPVQETN